MELILEENWCSLMYNILLEFQKEKKFGNHSDEKPFQSTDSDRGIQTKLGSVGAVYDGQMTQVGSGDECITEVVVMEACGAGVNCFAARDNKTQLETGIEVPFHLSPPTESDVDKEYQLDIVSGSVQSEPGAICKGRSSHVSLRIPTPGHEYVESAGNSHTQQLFDEMPKGDLYNGHSLVVDIPEWPPPSTSLHWEDGQAGV